MAWAAQHTHLAVLLLQVRQLCLQLVGRKLQRGQLLGQAGDVACVRRRGKARAGVLACACFARPSTHMTAAETRTYTHAPHARHPACTCQLVARRRCGGLQVLELAQPLLKLRLGPRERQLRRLRLGEVLLQAHTLACKVVVAHTKGCKRVHVSARERAVAHARPDDCDSCGMCPASACMQRSTLTRLGEQVHLVALQLQLHRLHALLVAGQLLARLVQAHQQRLAPLLGLVACADASAR